ncbi:MAG: hypothetical protein HQK92_04495 [Nitrospirae bacterium]|nr:hypothetical protein [Nitrospirota bacterium]
MSNKGGSNHVVIFILLKQSKKILDFLILIKILLVQMLIAAITKYITTGA